MREIKEIGEDFETVAEILNGSTLAKYAAVFEKWFPDKSFTLENFKKMPCEIIKLFAVDCMCMLIKQYFADAEDIGLKTLHALALGYQNVLRAMMNAYHVDLIDFETELRKRGYSDIKIENIRRWFI